MIQKLFGYWEVWHIVLATYLYLILSLFFTKQITFALVMATAVLWEVGEYIYQSYKDFKSYGGDKQRAKVNALKDLLAALLSCVILNLILKGQ